MFEEEWEILHQIHGFGELEKHVVASLHEGNITILKPIHFGAFGDPVHFNITTPYSGIIHVYVQWFGDRWGYMTMTDMIG
jgi:hypothetical protein